MPALYLFNRRTLLAGDDLQLPSLAWGFLSAVQLFILIPYLIYFTIEIFLSPIEETEGVAALDDFFERGSNDLLIIETAMKVYTDNEVVERIPHKSQLFDLGAYISSLKSSISYAKSSACVNATAEFRDLPFPYFIIPYLIGMSIFCSISMWYERRIFRLSSLGTPTVNSELRLPLGKIIETKITYLTGINLCLLMYGCIISFRFFGYYNYCFPKTWWIVLFILLASQSLHFLINVTTLVSIWRMKPTITINGFGRNGLSTAVHESTPSSLYHHHTDYVHHHTNAQIAEEMWRSRCECCCRILALSTCYLFGGQSIISQSSEGGGERFYGDISRALADYFAGFCDGVVSDSGLDVVPSDIALGFVVLRHIQAQRILLGKRESRQQTNGKMQDINKMATIFRWKNKSSPYSMVLGVQQTEDQSHGEADLNPRPDEEYQSFSRVVLSPLNPEHVAIMKEGAHFARYQLAIYTWILYYYMFPVTGTLRLAFRSMKEKLGCISIRSGERQHSSNLAGLKGYGKVVGDNFLHIHESSMLAHADLRRSDIAYASFESGFYQTPYCIIIDKDWKSIVLSIRGSLTLEDCLVDVLLDPSPLDLLGEEYGFSGNGQFCHGGVLSCTQWLHTDLMRHGILEKLLRGNSKFSEYTLRIVGHSLGAGIGVILSFMLRNSYPNLRCLCFSPPGGLLTWELANKSSDFVNTFILDSDIVPRLSLCNMERLRDEVLTLIARVKLSKHSIVKRLFWHNLLGEVELNDLDYLLQQNGDMLHPCDCIPDSDFLHQLRQFEYMQQDRRSSRGILRSISLYPPGRIIHLVKTDQSKRCVHNITACISCGASNAGSEYTPIIKENDDFNEVEISPTLWTDHFPNRVCLEIERVAVNFGMHTTMECPSDLHLI